MRMSRLLEEAIDLDEPGRHKWLGELSPENQDLKEALRQGLLVSGEFEPLSEGARAATIVPSDVRGLKVGDRVGPYLLMRALGHGGMAEVWLAARVDGVLKREVALKVPALNVLRQDLAQRFALERDILAGLEHPNIARLYDAGVTAEALPYLAMEFVPGKSLGAWADEQRLGVSSRIELFLQVLEAVQYAHDRGVLHRDIKPSNVLVTDKGQVRLLDFGVAKLLQTDQASLTRVYGRAFTPEYASPEQILGEPLQERSDIYSLGVMLYELLAGSPPYRISARDSAGWIEKTANGAQIERPSAQVGVDAATARATTPKKLARRLRGDLDAIVLKCLAKSPADRYASAAAVVEDLRRYLAAEPVQAQPGTPSYRLTKFVLRHRAGVAVTGLLALLAGLLAYERIRPPEQTAAAPTPVALMDKSIAVLPFTDMSEHHDQEYFSDGLSEELIERLSRSQDLKVIARTSSFYFKGKQATIGEIAKTLKVSNVLEGSVRKDDQQLRISAQLVRASDGVQLWSQTYDRNASSIFKLQDEIASTVAQSLNATLVARDLTASGRMVSTDAYNLLLQGNYFYDRSNLGDDDKAIEYYKKAIEVDPGYAMAWAKAGYVYAIQALRHERLAKEVEAEARACVARALKIDPSLAYAHFALSTIYRIFDWDWRASRMELLRTISLDPVGHLAQSTQNLLARSDMVLQENAEGAIPLLLEALHHDPLDITALVTLARTQFVAEHWDASAASYRKVLEMNPNRRGAHASYGWALLFMGKPVEALAEAEKEPDKIQKLSVLPAIYWGLRRKRQSDVALVRLETEFADIAPTAIAENYTYRGDKNKAFAWLARAYQSRDPLLRYLKFYPSFRTLHEDPRFQTLLVKMKLD